MKNVDYTKEQLYKEVQRSMQEFYDDLYNKQEDIPEDIAKVINEHWFEFL